MKKLLTRLRAFFMLRAGLFHDSEQGNFTQVYKNKKALK